AGNFVAAHIALQPLAKGRLLGRLNVQLGLGRVGIHNRVGRLGEEAFGAINLGLGEFVVAIFQMQPFRLDFLSEDFRCHGAHQNFNPGFEFVVATAVLVVDAQYGFEIGKQVFFWQEVANGAAYDRRAAQAATHINFKAYFATILNNQLQADIVHLHGGAILLRTCNRNFEFAWQEGELRMKGRPLTNNFAIGAGIDDFVFRHTGKLVRGGVANAVAARLGAV